MRLIAVWVDARAPLLAGKFGVITSFSCARRRDAVLTP
jgi:hypothetical protein